MIRKIVPLVVLAATPASALDLTSTLLSNPTAYIPSQCYTKTVDAAGTAHNPCQTCHVRSRAPHYINDHDLQLSYSFPSPALKNPWTNLFVDRSAAVAATDPDDIRAWVRQDNYFDAAGKPLLADILAHPPQGWDADGDGKWTGFVPDTYFAFDDDGFDRAPDGSMTGWRAFAYQPLPGTFWPANGSTDDVLIRLPEAYRQIQAGARTSRYTRRIFAITEALIKRTDIAIEPTDEAAMGVDLDRDGTLGMATRVAFAFAPLDGITMGWAGLAGTLPAADAPLAAGLYPLGTEFLHTLRYIDTGDDGDVRLAARMKEVRYMRKTRWQTYFDRQESALAGGQGSASPSPTASRFSTATRKPASATARAGACRASSRTRRARCARRRSRRRCSAWAATAASASTTTTRWPSRASSGPRPSAAAGTTGRRRAFRERPTWCAPTARATMSTTCVPTPPATSSEPMSN
ncbi:MAG: hypothetical protein H6891_08465 [Brucellaceae bacterium]|nr:hypothetical protein [Brucellaceae bacterium]